MSFLPWHFSKRGHLAFQPRQSGSVLDSAPYKPDRQLLFTIVVWMSRGKETWERICKHLLQISRFRLVVLRSHAALCYAVNHCYVYLVTQTSGPTAAWGLKLLFHLETQPKLSWAPKPTLGPLKGLKLGFKEPEEFPLVFLVGNGSSLLEYKRGPQLGTLWQLAVYVWQFYFANFNYIYLEKSPLDKCIYYFAILVIDKVFEHLISYWYPNNICCENG